MAAGAAWLSMVMEGAYKLEAEHEIEKSGLAMITASLDFSISCPASCLYVASINIDSHAAPAAITPAVVDGHIGGS